MDTIATASLRKRHPDLQYSIGLYCNKILKIFTIFEVKGSQMPQSKQSESLKKSGSVITPMHLNAKL